MNRFFLPLFLALLLGCSSAQSKTNAEPDLTVEEFRALVWQKKLEHLERMLARGMRGEDANILAVALEDGDAVITTKALEVALLQERGEHLALAEKLLASNNPMVRWRAMLYLEKFSTDPALVHKIAARFDDREWLVREAAFRMLRRFPEEKKQRRYFYKVLFHLNEKNAQVVAEIYRTLVWYEDPSAWPYLIKRSYHCRSVSELLLVMEELARTKNREAQVRLKTLTRSQSGLVRDAAKRLLETYF
ncbi:MAG: hypothetical protein N2Z22_07525 [Turneriella sp.]|nr:hypothetical protein [Turneriella sp.]